MLTTNNEEELQAVANETPSTKAGIEHRYLSMTWDNRNTHNCQE